MFSQQLEALFSGIQSGSIVLKCERSLRAAVAVNTREPDLKSAFMCARCLIQRLHTTEIKDGSVVPLADFVAGLQVLLQSWKTSEMQVGLIDESIQNFANSLREDYHQSLAAAFQKNMEFTNQHLTLLSPPKGEEMIKIPLPQENNGSEDPKSSLLMLIDLFRHFKNRKDLALAIKLPKLNPQNKGTKEVEETQIQSILQGEVYRKVAHINSLAGGYPPIDSSVEIVQRYKSFTEKRDFELYRTISLCVKVTHPTVWYGFSHYYFSEVTQGLCNLSMGRMNNHDSLLDVFEFAITSSPNQGLEFLSKVETEPTNVVLFPNPVHMVPEVWYNLAVRFDQNAASKIAMVVRGQGVASLSLVSLHKLPSGNEVALMLGNDDTTNFSVYSGLVPNLFFKSLPK